MGRRALAVWLHHAHRSNARAQAEISRCFVSGWGVTRDVDLALKWLLPAAKAGDPLGQSLLADFYFNGEDGTVITASPTAGKPCNGRRKQPSKASPRP